MSRAILSVQNARRLFDVSKPWLERRLSGEGRRYVHAVEEISLDILAGETLGLVGESGSGKSTLGRMTVGLLAPTAGHIAFEGGEVAEAARAGRLQMIFQDPFASLNPRWKVVDIVGEPLLARGGGGDVKQRVAELLTLVGLSPVDGEKYPHEFSGGQRQRIAIARAIAGEPDFIVADEPTSALDVSVQAQILNLLRDLQRRLGLTMLFITHNLAVIRHMADRVGVMYLGRLVEIAPTRELFAAPRHPYTRMLIEAIPDPHAPKRDRAPISGEIPSPIDPPPGCAFHPRCPLAFDRCRRELPKLIGGVACHAVDEVEPRTASPGG
ncbi:MAG: ABC transporter ATP-binding protein [Hyphomicrobiales bacterium]|nr:ABC transporter ATP-binding protein [Hyphomicrobiales bacterium]